jgi:hypothetical protein
MVLGRSQLARGCEIRLWCDHVLGSTRKEDGAEVVVPRGRSSVDATPSREESDGMATSW